MSFPQGNEDECGGKDLESTLTEHRKEHLRVGWREPFLLMGDRQAWSPWSPTGWAQVCSL